MSALFTSVQFADRVCEQSLTELLSATIQTNPAALMLLCADDVSLDLALIEAFLQSQHIPIFGGIFPGLLFAGEVKNTGVLLAGVSQNVHIELLSNLSTLSSPKFTLTPQLLSCPSMMVLVDGLARNIDPCLQHLFNQVGHSIRVVGGGAGSLSFKQKPCLFTNQGLSQDAMLLVGMSNQLELAIAHGWQKLAGPYLANQVDGNVVEQLNFQPALEVYQQVIEHHSGLKFSEHEFFAIAKTYPFGIERLDDDVLVRDPITCEQNHMVCVGKIPDNTMLYILHGEADNLISASVNAVQEVLSEYSATHTFYDGFLFDCISRQLFLEDRFVEELQGISSTVNENQAIIGVLVLGEIASGAAGSINFHNKTAVTVLSCKQSKTTGTKAITGLQSN